MPRRPRQRSEFPGRRLAIIIGVLLLAALAVWFIRTVLNREREPREPEVVNVDTDRTSSEPASAAGISVYFSHCYANNAKAAEQDTSNIDRACARMLSTARTSIDAALYELGSKRVADALIAAKRRGVRVRIVSDSDYRENEEMQAVIEAGIPVVFDERSALMHDKFFVVDGRTVWAGSWNATDNCSWRNNNNAVRIDSRELAENYGAEFAEMFEMRKFGPDSPARTPHPTLSVGGTRIENFFAPEDRIAPKLVAAIRGAKRSIHIMAFSFTEPSIASALIEREGAGVKVEGVVEARGSDATGGQRGRLADAGASMLRDGNKYVMHHKVMIIDGETTVLGSYNFTTSADRSNDENMLIIHNRAVAAQFEEEYARIRKMAADQPA